MHPRAAKTVKTAKTVMKATPLKLDPPFSSSCKKRWKTYGGFSEGGNVLFRKLEKAVAVSRISAGFLRKIQGNPQEKCQILGFWTPEKGKPCANLGLTLTLLCTLSPPPVRGVGVEEDSYSLLEFLWTVGLVSAHLP